MWQARVESLPVPPLPPWRCLHSWTGCLRKRQFPYRLWFSWSPWSRATAMEAIWRSSKVKSWSGMTETRVVNRMAHSGVFYPLMGTQHWEMFLVMANRPRFSLPRKHAFARLGVWRSGWSHTTLDVFGVRPTRNAKVSNVCTAMDFSIDSLNECLLDKNDRISESVDK